eukprot:8583018-Alexandrium_andersonii.AAC.1
MSGVHALPADGGGFACAGIASVADGDGLAADGGGHPAVGGQAARNPCAAAGRGGQDSESYGGPVGKRRESGAPGARLCALRSILK